MHNEEDEYPDYIDPAEGESLPPSHHDEEDTLGYTPTDEDLEEISDDPEIGDVPPPPKPKPSKPPKPTIPEQIGKQIIIMVEDPHTGELITKSEYEERKAASKTPTPPLQDKDIQDNLSSLPTQGPGTTYVGSQGDPSGFEQKALELKGQYFQPDPPGDDVEANTNPIFSKTRDLITRPCNSVEDRIKEASKISNLPKMTQKERKRIHNRVEASQYTNGNYHINVMLTGPDAKKDRVERTKLLELIEFQLYAEVFECPNYRELLTPDEIKGVRSCLEKREDAEFRGKSGLRNNVLLSDIIDVKEASKILGVCKRAVVYMVSKGVLDTHNKSRKGREKILFLREEILSYLERKYSADPYYKGTSFPHMGFTVYLLFMAKFSYEKYRNLCMHGWVVTPLVEEDFHKFRKYLSRMIPESSIKSGNMAKKALTQLIYKFFEPQYWDIYDLIFRKYGIYDLMVDGPSIDWDLYRNHHLRWTVDLLLWKKCKPEKVREYAEMQLNRTVEMSSILTFQKIMCGYGEMTTSDIRKYRIRMNRTEKSFKYEFFNSSLSDIQYEIGMIDDYDNTEDMRSMMVRATRAGHRAFDNYDIASDPRIIKGPIDVMMALDKRLAEKEEALNTDDNNPAIDKWKNVAADYETNEEVIDVSELDAEVIANDPTEGDDEGVANLSAG